MRVAPGPGKCLCSSFTCFSECSPTFCSQHQQQQKRQPQLLQQFHVSLTIPPIPDAAGVDGRGLVDGEEEGGDSGDGKGEGIVNAEHGAEEWGEHVDPADGEKLPDAISEVARKRILKKPLDLVFPAVSAKGKSKMDGLRGKRARRSSGIRKQTHKWRFGSRSVIQFG